jgi:hypothetical protein
MANAISTPSDTRSIEAAHMMLSFAFYASLGVAESVAFSLKVPNLSLISFALPFSVH